MHSGPTRQLRAFLLGAAVVTGLWTTATWSQGAAQPSGQGGRFRETRSSRPAATKAREGRIDEALGLIKEKAAKHPEWPPSQLILARLLFRANQVVPGRRALEQAAVDAPDHPDVYLTLGRHGAGGRKAQRRPAQLRECAHRWSAPATGMPRKQRVLRREALAGLAAVAEAREDWKTTQARLNAWLELEPQEWPGSPATRPSVSSSSARRTTHSPP